MLSVKDSALVFLQGQEKDHTEDTAGYDLTGSYCQHHEGDWEQDAVSVAEYKRYDDHVGDDRGERCEETVLVAETVSEDSTD